MPEQPRPWRESWRDRVAGGAAIAGIAFRSDRVAVTVSSVLSVIQLSIGQLSAVGLKWITDAVVLGRPALGWRGVLLYGAVFAFSNVALVAAFPARMRVREKTSHAIDQELMALATGAPTLEHFERPVYADRLELLRTGRMQLGSVPDMLIFNVGSVAQLAIGMAILSTAHPALLALPLFGIPAVVVAQRTATSQQQLLERQAENTRTRGHLFRVGVSPIAGKEVRIFGLGPTLVERRTSLWRRADRELTRFALGANTRSAAAWALFAAAYIGGIALVAGDAVAGRATPGDVVLAITVAARIRGFVQQLYGMVQQMSAVLISAERFAWLRAHTASAVAAALPAAPKPIPVTLDDGIVFSRVSFRYPGTDTDVLRDVDLRLPAGATVAIVGDNGAGKTTLVKLVARYYDPTGGVIEVDGTDLREFDSVAWRSRLSAGFQDFARFELEARHAVGVGDLDRLDDIASVRTALDRAAASELEAALPSGLDTLVGRSFHGGVELSGGQWQKLAIGRALMRDEPLVLLLDEPTANLDAQTEHALFERYAGAARRAAGRTGAITLLVSHRFSTVRMADLIVVVDGNTIREAGTHAELVAAQGTYAELYELQARAYR